jgi:hypothetical protein
MALLGELLREHGQLQRAREVLETTAEAFGRVNGAEHYQTTEAQWQLVQTLRILGDEAAAGQVVGRLCWLVDREPNTLIASQPDIREAVASSCARP